MIAAEDFGRKPTRASAPSAPHSLSKKIAALDLLSSGIPIATAAAQHGITVNLLEQWKSSEAVLRQVCTFSFFFLGIINLTLCRVCALSHHINI
ncbi:unnamed protein product [Dibothriocephalus latus]|uniref:Uncharacterized protein n=1 Tax=Dibothriocephalus latus TaxID=60516 RepID=A0A3P7NET3_DIBLA|nr:unnamed protein product [Dibothriocephalus latus]